MQEQEALGDNVNKDLLKLLQSYKLQLFSLEASHTTQLLIQSKNFFLQQELLFNQPELLLTDKLKK